MDRQVRVTVPGARLFRIDRTWCMWDNSTMTITADSKKRIVLPTAKPGDVFDVHRQGRGQFLLVRLARPEPRARMNQTQCLRAISASPLHPKMRWEMLRALTREP